MRGLGRRDDRRVGNQREMDTRVWHQVSLELIQIDVERSVEAKRGSDGRYNLKRLAQISCETKYNYLERSSG